MTSSLLSRSPTVGLALIWLSLSAPARAQQVYVPGTGTPDHSCGAASTPTAVKPSYHFSSFSFSLTETTRTATAVPTTSPATTYAKPYSAVSTLLSTQSSTTWPNWTPFGPGATDIGNPYGDFSYSQLWNDAAPSSFSRGIYSTTVSPTPVPTSELIYPPPPEFQPRNCYTFPEDFIFGVAGSAAQCEGAVADHGKSPSVLDMLQNILSPLLTVPNDYVTNEHYYLYQNDITRFAAIGAKYYYFTIPWTRVLPFAYPGTPVNQDAIQHYNDVIDFILSKGMQPVIALTHFDTPLQFYGKSYQTNFFASPVYYDTLSHLNAGYQEPDFPAAFVNYAKIVLTHYADRVPFWITYNEPQNACINGVAVDHVIKSHAQVVHFYREELGGTGRVSMKMGLPPANPLDPTNSSHVETALTFNDLYLGPFLNPLALGKDYPDAFKQAIQDYVPLNASDLDYLNGTIDFIAQDSYGPAIVYPLVENFTACAMDNSSSNANYRFPICINQTRETRTGWAVGWDLTGSSANYIAPVYLRTQLSYLWNTFKLPVLISEFGLQAPPPIGGDELDDRFNVPTSSFILGYLSEMLNAIWEDGVHVMGALVWNWGDDWEFLVDDTGFGVQSINHTTQERIYRRSFFDSVDFVESRREKS